MSKKLTPLTPLEVQALGSPWDIYGDNKTTRSLIQRKLLEKAGPDYFTTQAGFDAMRVYKGASANAR